MSRSSDTDEIYQRIERKELASLRRRIFLRGLGFLLPVIALVAFIVRPNKELLLIALALVILNYHSWPRWKEEKETLVRWKAWGAGRSKA